MPTISDLTPTEGQALTANTAASRILTGWEPFSFQWQASNNNGATWTNIAGAINATFTPVQAQVNQLLRVNVTFTDGGNTLRNGYIGTDRRSSATISPAMRS